MKTLLIYPGGDVSRIILMLAFVWVGCGSNEGPQQSIVDASVHEDVGSAGTDDGSTLSVELFGDIPVFISCAGQCVVRVQFNEAIFTLQADVSTSGGSTWDLNLKESYIVHVDVQEVFEGFQVVVKVKEPEQHILQKEWNGPTESTFAMLQPGTCSFYVRDLSL